MSRSWSLDSSVYPVACLASVPYGFPYRLVKRVYVSGVCGLEWERGLGGGSKLDTALWSLSASQSC
jgi:hypothetical protein